MPGTTERTSADRVAPPSPMVSLTVPCVWYVTNCQVGRSPPGAVTVTRMRDPARKA